MDRVRPPRRNHGARILRRCRGSPDGGSRDGLLRDDLYLRDRGHVGRAADAGGNLGARPGGEDLPATFDGEVGGRIHRDDAHRGAQGACVQTGMDFPPFGSCWTLTAGKSGAEIRSPHLSKQQQCRRGRAETEQIWQYLSFSSVAPLVSAEAAEGVRGRSEGVCAARPCS